MSSGEDDYDSNIVSKKRRVQRACDICRRKKIRCNGVQMPGNKCSNCITYNYDCTYVETAKKRGPSKGYVESLENRLHKLEMLLKRLCPDESLLRELDIAIEKEDFNVTQPPLDPSPLFSSTTSSKSPFHSNPYSPDPATSSNTITTTNTNTTDTSPSTDDHSVRNVVDIVASILRRYGSAHLQPPPADDAQCILSDQFKLLSIEQPKDYRFFGKSSGVMLIQTALDLKHEYTGKETILMKPEDLSLKRDRFWKRPHWEEQTLISLTSTRPSYDFPDPDLLNSLVDLYFKHINILMPLLHRPTFERAINEGLHLQDDKFGANVLLVCANGARFCDDPRVLSEVERERERDEEGKDGGAGTGGGEEDGVCEGEGKDNERTSTRKDLRHSSGWTWFEQVQMVKKSFLTPSNLYDLQFYALSVLFLHGSSAHQACWAMVGVGIRLAQDVGAHRKRKTEAPLTVEDELWKRAFWVLVSIDRGISSALGRPCAVHDEDFDIDFPVDCDDEYWEHPDPEQRWKQPPGKPSLVAAFVCSLKLTQVLAFSLRTIYSINKSKILLGLVGNQWEQLIVAELDSALNRFVDSVPDHLRWDPDREDQQFFIQSVMLWTSYYHIQILIHRPFIPSPSKPSPLSFPSLAICTNAARSCIHVVDVLHKRFECVYPPVQMAVFTSSIVLLVSIWGGRQNGLMTDSNKEMKDVHRAMTILKSSERRWHSAGRLWDLLYELASVGDLPLPQQVVGNNKRERNSDSPISSNVSENANTPPLGPRSVAGSKRVSSVNRRQQHQQQQQQQQQQPLPPQPPPPPPIPPIPPQQQQQQQQQQHTPASMFHHPTIQISQESSSSSFMDSPTAMTQSTHQGMVNLPLYSNELGRMPLGGGGGESKFETQSSLLPSLSGSHMHSRLPQHHQHHQHHHQHPHQQHQQQHQQHQQALDPGYWYSYGPSHGHAQMRGLQGMGSNIAPQSHLVPSAGPSSGIGSSTLAGAVSTSGSTHLDGAAGGGGQGSHHSGFTSSSSTSEADFIFGQLAMGYPMAFANDFQTATLSQMLETGMFSGGGGGGGGNVGGASVHGGQGMHRYSGNVGRGVGGEGMGGGSGTTSPGYPDNSTMNMQWPGPSTGFQ